MRQFQITAKYLLIFLFVCVVTAIAGGTALSYYTVDALTQVASKQTESEPNLSAVLKLTGSYLEDIRQYEEFLHGINGDKWPSFCSVICNPSAFDNERYLNDRTPYLVTYYKQQKKTAPQDPIFRLKVAQLDFLRENIPNNLRYVMHDILFPKDAHSKAYLSLRLEGAVIRELPFAKSRYATAKARLEVLDQVRTLANSCNTIRKKDLVKQCEDLVPGG